MHNGTEGGRVETGRRGDEVAGPVCQEEGGPAVAGGAAWVGMSEPTQAGLPVLKPGRARTIVWHRPGPDGVAFFFRIVIVIIIVIIIIIIIIIIIVIIIIPPTPPLQGVCLIINVR